MTKEEQPTNRELLIKIESLCALNKKEFEHIKEKIDGIDGNVKEKMEKMEKLKGKVDANTRWRYIHTGAYAFAAFLVTTFWSQIKSVFNITAG